MEIFKPFGPSIAKFNIPEEIILKMNIILSIIMEDKFRVLVI